MEPLAAVDGSAVVGRALTIVETIANAARPLGLPEICALSRLPKATAHRLCRQLREFCSLALTDYPLGWHHHLRPSHHPRRAALT